MTPDEVVIALKKDLRLCKAIGICTHLPDKTMSDKIQALTFAISLIQDYQKLRGKVDKLELIKIADKSLGYNGLGTKMTPKEIDKMFSAIVTYLQQPTEHIAR